MSPTASRRDVNTQSNYNELVTTHAQVDLSVDFENRLLGGRVILDLAAINETPVSEVILDTSYLKVREVGVNSRPCEWKVLPRSEPLGSPLKISLEKAVSKERQSGDNSLYSFRQDIPIPSYLFALASGDIAKASIGPRSTIATSPELLEAAKWEFEQDTENYIQSLERIVYQYQWSEYNLLVLPPSFPYGGMENPVYTYVTPTTVSGDRENVDVVAHELSHSFSGNLVTAATWADFWLNEGWTTYLERRLQAALFGEPHRDFSAIIGWKALCESVKEFGDHHEFTKLIPDVSGKDPDDAFSTCPYEKGYTFLSYLESQVGKEKWNQYIPHYFTTFARRSLTSDEFKQDLHTFFASDSAATAMLNAVDWHQWFYSPGLPPKPTFDTSLADVCYSLAAQWEQIGSRVFKPSQDDIAGWKANQVVVFLNAVQDFVEPLGEENAQKMGETYGFFKSSNTEITARYFGVGLRSRAKVVYQPTADLLGDVGRMKFIRPLYKQLNAADRELALATFEKNKDFYHPICRSLVEKDLAVKRDQ
ncbi:uncharacterized protein KY384_003149 [Bacidia gigantensis]|uniref:uncharacterized protein n=1 Tax=Bacidia gigantensis TaxID=2732470 RepID=UPI001D03A9EB|nr:uncharacterized protein KY384_003149 [Bacidia gigantensis]KAG8531520.1 hypothetical protein KY384_003149 [Bacidia gigantensis]